MEGNMIGEEAKAVTRTKATTMGFPITAVRVPDAARMFGLGKTTLWRAIHDGRLRSSRVGRRVLLRPGDVEAWIEAETRYAASRVDRKSVRQERSRSERSGT
jgi:excisionase family DNA binding protein